MIINVKFCIGKDKNHNIKNRVLLKNNKNIQYVMYLSLTDQKDHIATIVFTDNSVIKVHDCQNIIVS
jgi:hypothetical protein